MFVLEQYPLQEQFLSLLQQMEYFCRVDKEQRAVTGWVG